MNPGGPSLIAATLPDSLINPNRDRPNLEYEFLGVTRVWRWTRERMQKAYEDGLIVQSKPGRVPQLMRFLDEQRGRPLGRSTASPMTCAQPSASHQTTRSALRHGPSTACRDSYPTLSR